MTESSETSPLSRRDQLVNQLTAISDRIEAATDKGYSASSEDYEKRTELQRALHVLDHPGETSAFGKTMGSKGMTPGPIITGYGSMDKMGRFGQVANRRGNTKK